jgi:hypothetical protein
MKNANIPFEVRLTCTNVLLAIATTEVEAMEAARKLSNRSREAVLVSRGDGKPLSGGTQELELDVRA